MGGPGICWELPGGVIGRVAFVVFIVMVIVIVLVVIGVVVVVFRVPKMDPNANTRCTVVPTEDRCYRCLQCWTIALNTPTTMDRHCLTHDH
jgi:uncharacterized membrane protein